MEVSNVSELSPPPEAHQCSTSCRTEILVSPVSSGDAFRSCRRFDWCSIGRRRRLASAPAFGADDTWIGNTSNLWSVPANWSSLPVTGDNLIFGAAGSAGTTLLDDLMTPATFNIGSITFNAGALGFTINPNAVGTNGITLTGPITNNATNPETLNDSIVTTANRTVTVGTGGSLVLGGAISGAGGGITKAGTGALTLGGANTYTGATLVNGGVVNLTGSIIATGQPNPFVQVGGGNGVSGVLNVLPGSTLSGSTEMWVALADGGYGAINNTGGSITSGSWFALGRGGGQGLYNQTAGSLTVNTNPLTIGSFGGATSQGFVHGQVNVSGGTLTANNQPIFVGEQSLATMNISGTAQVTAGGVGVEFAPNNAAAAGSILNLLGGTLSTPRVFQNQGAGIFNFNGGTLKATVSAGNFMQGLLGGIGGGAYVYAGGATIDDGGNNITINQPLVAPTGNGLSATGLTVSGGGFIRAPIVQITGDGFGATANATIDANGNLTGIVITNPGQNYNSATFTLLGGGTGNTGAINGAPTLVPNTSGPLTKTGSGTLTLGGANTYTGNTTVSAGTLIIGPTGSLASTNPVTIINGAKLIQGSATPIQGLVTVTNGTLDGTGQLTSATVASSATNVVTNGGNGIQSVASPLTLSSSLTFQGAAKLVPVTAPLAANTPAISAASLTASGPAGSISVSPVSTIGGFPNGTYQLVSYTGSIGGTGFPAFTLNLSGLGVRQSAALTNPAGLIDLVVSGNSAVWTGGAERKLDHDRPCGAEELGAVLELGPDRLRLRRRRDL